MTTEATNYDDRLEHACEATLGLFHFFLERSLSDIADTYRSMASAYAETMPGHKQTTWCVSHLRDLADNAEKLMDCLRLVSQLPAVVTPDEADAVVDPICDHGVPIEFEYGPSDDQAGPLDRQVTEDGSVILRRPDATIVTNSQAETDNDLPWPAEEEIEDLRREERRLYFRDLM